jgi:hypothetical protein
MKPLDLFLVTAMMSATAGVLVARIVYSFI